MAIQFGMARMIMRDTFDTPAPTPAMIELGCVQSGSIDFAYDKATLFCGDKLFPMDVRYHSCQITGRAAFAKLTATGFEYLIGGSKDGANLDVDWTSQPKYWSLEFLLVTSSVTFKVTLYKCTSGNLSFGFARDSHVIPEFNFSAIADDINSGRVARFELADVS